MKKIFFVLLVYLTSVYAEAAEEHFRFIKPADDAVTEALEWDNKTLAARISDVTQFAVMAMPFVVQLDEDKVGWRMAGTASTGRKARRSHPPPRRTIFGARTSRVSSCSPTSAIAIRSRSQTLPRAT